MRHIYIGIVIFLGSILVSHGQDSLQRQIDVLKAEMNNLKKEDNSNFMIRGFAQFGIDLPQARIDAPFDGINFNMTSFNPVLLWRIGDRLLFESELEMEYNDNAFSLGLGYANLSYMAAKGLVIKVGQLLIPFGTFSEKFHPSWVNKFSTAPLGMGHMDGMSPMADIGIEVRGGFQVGASKLSYAVYVVNGPRIEDGSMTNANAGMLSFENFNDNNNNKAVGARIGILPFTNSSMELGFSIYSGKPGNVSSPFATVPKLADLNYKDVSVNLAAIDFSYVKMLNVIKGIIDIKGQYNFSNVSSAAYYSSTDSMRYTFNNQSTAYYVALAYRPAMADNDVLKNFELALRYSYYETPKGSLWGAIEKQQEVGINYWFNWHMVLKLSYQITDVSSTAYMGGAGGITVLNNGRIAHTVTPPTTTMSGMSGMGSMTAVSGNMLLLHLAIGL